MILIKKKLLSTILIIGMISISLLNCKTRLAPEYDKAIVESITIVSEQTMSFLAMVSNGTNSNNFIAREEKYNALIGAYDALKIRAKARPVPNNVSTKKINELMLSRANNLIYGDYPSAFAFEKISETINKMKETDRKKGIKPIAMKAFKNQIEIFLDQAITYESFLKR